MGRTGTFKYRVEVEDGKGGYSAGWKSRQAGLPNDANLATYVFRYADSLKKGGANFHVSVALGYVPFPTKARIVHQGSGRTVASWQAGMFQVF